MTGPGIFGVNGRRGESIRFGLAGILLFVSASCTTTGIRQEPQPISDNVAVVTLADGARELRQRKVFEQAVAKLERALRIEPGNAFVWHELALVYLAQGNPDQAIQFAYKSSALTGDDSLRRRNDRLVKTAQSRLNKPAGSGADL